MNRAHLVRRNRQVPVSFGVVIVFGGRVVMCVRRALMMMGFMILNVDVGSVIAGMGVPYGKTTARSVARV